MRVFLDTSSLFKKYNAEEGSDKLFKVLEKATAVSISHITFLEIINTLNRYFRQFHIDKKEQDALANDIIGDFQHFEKIRWDDNLENICVNLSKAYDLKSLDVIQIASAKASHSQLFVTSDKKQHRVAKKELRKSLLI